MEDEKEQSKPGKRRASGIRRLSRSTREGAKRPAKSGREASAALNFPPSPPLRTGPEELRRVVEKEQHEAWKLPKEGPMTANWLKKVGYIHMMKHYTVLKITLKKKSVMWENACYIRLRRKKEHQMCHKIAIKKKKSREFPDRPVLRTLWPHCCGPRFNPARGTETLKTKQSSQKNKKV